MRTTTAHLLTTLALAAAPTAALAGDLHVPADHATIQEAVDAAGDGDRVVVAEGVYEENVVVIGLAGFRLEARGEVVLDASGRGPALEVVGSREVAVQGLTCVDADEAGIYVASCLDTRIEGCRVETVVGHGVHVVGGTGIALVGNRVGGVEGDGIRFENDPVRCTVTGNEVDDAAGNGMYLDGEEHVVRRNRITRAGEWGVRSVANDSPLVRIVVEDVDGVGIHVGGANSPVIRCDVTDTERYGIFVNRSGCPIVRCTVTRANDSGIVAVSADCDVIKCTVDRTRHYGILSDGLNSDVVKCTVIDAARLGVNHGHSAIWARGEGGKVKRCRIVTPQGEGIRIGHPGMRLERCKVLDAGDRAITIAASEVQVIRNKVLGAGTVGISVEHERGGNRFVGNVVARTGEAGISVDSGGNTFVKNRVKASEGFDLIDYDPSGTNVYRRNRLVVDTD